MMSKKTIFWLFTSSIACVLLLPLLFQKGLFLDGITYGAIANNYANGLGDFWTLHHNKISEPIFYGHPPFAIYLEGLFFKLFSTDFYMERLFSVITAILSGFGLVVNWKLFSTEKNFNWLPVFLWISLPIVFWSYQNNLLENTLTALTLFTVYFLSKFAIKTNYTHLTLGCIFLILSFLTKGFVGLFPLAVPALYWLVFKPYSFSKGLINNLLTLSISVLLFTTMLLIFPEAQNSLKEYINIQISPSLKGELDVTTSFRLYLFLQLFIELSIPILLAMFLYFKFKKHVIIKSDTSKPALFIILIGVSASLPLIVSLKQRNFYLVPSMGFFALGIALFTLPYIKFLLNLISEKILTRIKWLSLTLIALSITISVLNFGNYSRSEELIKDVEKLSNYFPYGTCFNHPKNVQYEFALYDYMVRYGYLNVSNKEEFDYLLVKKSNPVKAHTLKDYNEVEIELNLYKVYKRIANPQ